jgi:molybdopterin-containing oxidoreductase family iron-sulfur binding subunit
MADDLTRRAMMGAVGLTFAAGAAKQVAPMAELTEGFDLDAYLQRHYKQLSREDMEKILRRIEAETLREYGAEVEISDPRPTPGVQFGYGLNLSVCIGCRKCVQGCHRENNHDRPTYNSYIRVLEMAKGGNDLEESNTTYDHVVPQPNKFYMPVQCHQCDNPPCVKACITKATWKEADGVVVVDYNWCIGCRYCISACPYEARRFNWTRPSISADEINPDQGYLSNRMRPIGVVEKCTFCLHRTRQGQFPACLEACPTGARAFGNMLDPNSEIRWILENKRVYILKAEAGTLPRFFYFFDE